ncbi:MAG: toxin-activating lysine-acyltransferase [Hyphomicrobium sp.]|nr:toxin-activating lysine-acyltransferase [Hyphomicrobium sp.]
MSPHAAAAAPVSAQASASAGDRTKISPQDVQFALAFTRIVMVLMRSQPYRQTALADLEALVLPPVMTGQFAFPDAQVNGQAVPVAVALWAFVSPEVDQRLSQNFDAPIRLAPHEWRSGDTLWLVDAIGDARALPQLLASLQQTAFKGRDAKMTTVSASGARVVQILKAVA